MTMRQHVKENAVIVLRARKRLGLSQEAFAHRLGVSVRTVSGWETGAHRPSPLALERIHSFSAPSPRS